MPDYIVTMSVTINVSVEAESREDAATKAIEVWQGGEVRFDKLEPIITDIEED